MKYNMTLLTEGLEKWGLAIESQQIEKFSKYMDMLLEWNKKMNLTSITEPNEVIINHFLDSLIILETGLIKENSIVMDVGTGAGLPGIPIKILKPNIKLILTDSLNKRMLFLKEVAYELKLDNVEIIHARAEELGQKEDYREQCDIVVSRAVAGLRVLAEYCLPFTRKNGHFIAYKGPGAQEELKEAKNAIKILGGSFKEILQVDVASSNRTHQLIIIQKTQETPKKYPRMPGKPKKSPL